MQVNLISDTITKPTPAMLEAMMKAEVGDDVFGEDPTANALEQKVATLFGKEAALFCPSGTMANQIAINVHTDRGDEVICDKTSHIYLYEAGGFAVNSGVSIALVEGQNGVMTAGQVEKAVRSTADWYPTSSLVVIENSCNRAGGSYYTLGDIHPIRKVCDHHNMKLHLDGARLFNVLVETGESPASYGEVFDSISICLSKGLGAPVGSMLIGSTGFIAKARKMRKMFGGGMRQVGYLAAAGIYALDHHVDRLKTDNERARRIGDILRSKPYIDSVLPVHTNIVVFTVADGIDPDAFLRELENRGVLGVPMSRTALRFVFHLDITEAMMQHLEQVLDDVTFD